MFKTSRSKFGKAMSIGLTLIMLSSFVVLCLPLQLSSVSAGEFVSDGASDEPEYILFDQGAANIYVHPDDHHQVLRTATDFQDDIERVTGKKPQINTTAPNAGTSVIVGSIDKSPVIQSIIAAGKLPEAAAITGKWEAFVIKLVENPVAGVDKALVIAGSDKRGAIFGMFDMSERWGVSPWYWWGDVPVAKSLAIGVPEGFIYSEGEPSVKYRGIFINDEWNLWRWSASLVDDDHPGQIGPAAYAKIFELLQRLKLNTIWPAMHEQGDEFYKQTDKGPFAEDGISLNAVVADKYAIVVGSSHCEMLTRNAADEDYNTWARRNYGKYDAAGLPAYDYSVNPQAIMAFWREHVEKYKDFEAIYSVGMRGRHDGEFGTAGLNPNNINTRTALLEKLINDQRAMLEEVIGKPANEIPQALIPYFEIANMYNNGLNLPDDIILMWAEDNHGQVRQISTDKERLRSGGAGVYYHNSYYGNPNSYLWISTTSNAHMYEELRKAYDTGARTYWITNIGDIKPHEISLEFFAALGRNIDTYSDKNLDEFYKKISIRDYDFDLSTAEAFSDVMERFYKLAHAKRPEFMGKGTQTFEFSRVNFGDEEQIHINRLNRLEADAKAIYDSLSPDKKDAFYQMVYYPIRVVRSMAEFIGYWRMHNTTRTQGRYLSAIGYEQLSRYAWNSILNDLNQYNRIMSGGKWDGIMDPIVTSGRIPRIQLPSNHTFTQPTMGSGLGSVCEGQTTGNETNITLQFSSLTKDSRFVDVFTRDASPKGYLITTSAPFIVPGKTSGTVAIEERIWVEIDWDALPAGVHEGNIYVYNTTVNPESPTLVKTFTVKAVKFDLADAKYAGADYIMANGYVAIEAEHYSRSVKGADGSEWLPVKNWGRSGDSMAVYPHMTSKSSRVVSNFQATAARLEYDIYFDAPGIYTVTFFRNPGLSEGRYDAEEGGGLKSVNAALSLNGAEPVGDAAGTGGGSPNTYPSTTDQILNGWRVMVNEGTTTRDALWQRLVQRQTDLVLARIEVPSAGVHTLNIFKVDSGVGFDRIVIEPGTAGTLGDSAYSYFGPTESYNASYDTYPAERGILPDLSVIPELDHVAKAMFTFGSVQNNYLNVAADRLYGGRNSYGWNAPTTQQTATTGGGTFHARDRVYQYGTEARTFTVTLPAPGKYIATFVIGHRGDAPVTRNVSGMSITSSGTIIRSSDLSNINVQTGRNMEYFCIVDTASPILSFTFAGNPWAITAIEILPYKEALRSGDGDGYFVLNSDRKLYIEAETALEQSEYAWTTTGELGTSWTESGGISGTAMYHGPNANVNYGAATAANPANLLRSATLNYKIIFQEPGNYLFWFSNKAMDTANDTIYFALNGEFKQERSFNPGTTWQGMYWLWDSSDNAAAPVITIADINQVYTLTIAGREDGMTIDKIYIAKEGLINGWMVVDYPCEYGGYEHRELREAPKPPVLPPVDTETKYFTETFNSYEIGDFTTNSFWQADTSTSWGIIDIVPDPSTPGNKLLRLARPVNTGIVSVQNRHPLGITGKYTIEARIMRTGAPTGTNNAWYIFGYDRNGFNPATPANNPAAAIVMSPSSVLNTYAARGSTTLTRVGATASRAWILVQIAVDMDTGTFDYYVNGARVITGGNLRTWASGNRLDYINLFTNVATTDVLNVDYIKVYRTPGVYFAYDGAPTNEIVPGKTLSVDAVFAASDDDSQTMFVALYNADGKLVKVESVEGFMSGEQINFEAEFDIPSNLPSGCFIKVFIWETGTFVPIREAVLFPKS